MKCWQRGPLLESGLGTVRKGWPKSLADFDFTAGMLEGRNMGAFMIVEIGDKTETRQDISGAPGLDGQGNIIAGGIKRQLWQVTLHVFHMAQRDYSEDAADDIDQLLEAIEQRIRVDRTLGGICTQAGEGHAGIRQSVGRPGIDPKKRTCTWSTIQFECMTQIIA